jgi:hypothetical protein
MDKVREMASFVAVVSPSRKYLPLKLRRLIDFLADSFRNPPWK